MTNDLDIPKPNNVIPMESILAALRKKAERKDTTAIKPGMCVIIVGADDINSRQPTAGLVLKVYPDNEPATDRNDDPRPWPGKRPFIDAIVVFSAPDDPNANFQPFVVSKIAHRDDIPSAQLEVGASGSVGETPCYLAVRKIDAE